MPGAKRKCDEDTWIVTQSKKFKCGQLLSNVYATTLAHLRLGARNFFQTRNSNGSKDSRDGSQSPSNRDGRLSPAQSLSPPPSPVIRDLISDAELSVSPGLQLMHPHEICHNCSFKKDGWEKCYYCEQVACHINLCMGCQYGFCSNCSITKYDNPDGETFACFACLH